MATILLMLVAMPTHAETPHYIYVMGGWSNNNDSPNNYGFGIMASLLGQDGKIRLGIRNNPVNDAGFTTWLEYSHMLSDNPKESPRYRYMLGMEYTHRKIYEEGVEINPRRQNFVAPYAGLSANINLSKTMSIELAGGLKLSSEFRSYDSVLMALQGHKILPWLRLGLKLPI